MTSEDSILVPCCPADPKTMFIFNHLAEMGTDGKWQVHRDTTTVYFGYLGPTVNTYRNTMNAGTDFNHAATLLAARELGIVSKHPNHIRIPNDEVTDPDQGPQFCHLSP